MNERTRTHLSNAAETVRAHDPDRYLATLFAPADRRGALFALFAFDHEIARVPEVVSQPMAGLIRLQWWRDALDAIDARQPPAQPVAFALHRDWARLGPAREHLHAAIDARERDLEEAPFADIERLEHHLEAGAGEIARAALVVLGVRDPAAFAAAREVALARGLLEMLRSAAAGGCARRLLPPAASRVAQVRTVAERARGHLESARRRAVPRRALPVLLPAGPVGDELRHLARSGHDPGAHATWRRSPLTPLKLLWRAGRGTF